VLAYIFFTFFVPGNKKHQNLLNLQIKPKKQQPKKTRLSDNTIFISSG